jgi:group I intron endonuclease
LWYKRRSAERYNARPILTTTCLGGDTAMAESKSIIPVTHKQLARRSGVYQIRCLANGKLYIGSTADLANRWGTHRHYLAKGTHHSVKLQRAWNKYGADAFVFEVLELTFPWATVEVEQRYLDEFRTFEPTTGYNVSPTASSTAGVVKTPEQCRAISERMKGKPQHPNSRAGIVAYWKGRKHTAETNAKRSAALTGRVFTDEHRAKISAAQKKRTPETIAKIADALRGRPLSTLSRDAISASGRRSFLTTDQISEIRRMLGEGVKQRDIAKVVGCCRATVSNVKNGKYIGYQVGT